MDGKEYIDAIASWYTCIYGHCNPYITNKVAAQMKELDQIVFSGFTHEPAVSLSEKLIEILPANQQKIFFSDNGSTATEIGIKMAFQYHFNKGEKRNVLLAFENAFHGDTFGAMSISDLDAYNGPFSDLLLDVKRIPIPTEENIAEILSKLEGLLENNNIAAFIYEPLVQGAAGMKMYKSQHLNTILELLRDKGVLLVVDEVMTGFGKTGTFFASDQIAIKPDIICLSKALTAGLLPMAISSCTQEVYNAFYDVDMSKGFFHAHTYSANPLSCTAAIAGIELLQSKEMQDNITRVTNSHADFAERIKDHPKVATTRQLGVIFALELKTKMDRYGNVRDVLFKHFIDAGVYLRPLGNTIYILAPFVITDSQLKKVYNAIEASFELID